MYCSDGETRHNKTRCEERFTSLSIDAVHSQSREGKDDNIDTLQYTFLLNEGYCGVIKFIFHYFELKATHECFKGSTVRYAVSTPSISLCVGAGYVTQLRSSSLIRFYKHSTRTNNWINVIFNLYISTSRTFLSSSPPSSLPWDSYR